MAEKKTKKNLLGITLSILFIIITVALLIALNKFNILNKKYFIILTLIITFITVILEPLLLFKQEKKIMKIIKIISMIITTVLIIIYIFIMYFLNKTMNLLSDIPAIKEEITNYYIIVLNDSKYQEPSDLYEQSLSYYEKINEEVINSIKLNLNYTKETDINTLRDKLYNKEVEAILISDILKNKYDEDDSNFETVTRILKTISITKEIEDITKRVSIKNTPFNVLISGIDTYGDINITSRNDVNIIATINPNTNEVLLTSIPRDYYVKLHGTEGYNDKLTHASYYGTNMVVQTIEDILETDINYYIKVNFTTVVELIDKIGGIEVYADQPLNIGNCHFIKGLNKVDGNCALVFSRERHSYIDGDRHRGRNQQEVIKAVFNKLSSGTAIISEYNNILSALDGKFATNIEISEATNYLKYELNDLKDYSIISIQLDGYGSMGKTYSYPGQDLWIMIPYEETIENAKAKINQVLNNETIK